MQRTHGIYRFFITSLLVLSIAVLQGCASYGAGIQKGLDEASRGQYAQAELTLSTQIKANGSDSLLHYMELGVLANLQNQYAKSNRLLEQAERVAERLEVRTTSDILASSMLNPREGSYQGAIFEKVLINYYKALNYLALAQQSKSNNEWLDNLENSRIEARRIVIKLNELNDTKGDYQAQKDKDEQTFAKIMKVFDLLSGDIIDESKFEYRDDAYAHYLTGLSFEMNQEWNNARISYEKSAKSYQQGFAKQYQLGSDMAQQAWLDTARMMKADGGYRSKLARLKKKTLTATSRKELANWNKDKAQLLVIEHSGIVPQRKEMNLILSVNPVIQSLELSPIFGPGAPDEQRAWFYVLYADKALGDVMFRYLDGSFLGFILGDFRKTVPLGPLYNVANKLGLLEAIGSGLRVTVPYYAPPKNVSSESSLLIDNQSYTMKQAARPSLLGIYEQVVEAQADIQTSLARSALKALVAQKAAVELANATGGNQFAGLLAGVGKLASQLTDAAETRNWLMLPDSIRIKRLTLEPGEHHLVLNSQPSKHKRVQLKQTVTLRAGEITLWKARAMPNMQTGQLGAPSAVGQGQQKFANQILLKKNDKHSI